MALSNDITLTEPTTDIVLTKVGPIPGGVRFIDTSSTTSEPRGLDVKYQKTLKQGVTTARNAIVAFQTELDANNAGKKSTVSLAISADEDPAITKAIVLELVKAVYEFYVDNEDRIWRQEL